MFGLGEVDVDAVAVRVDHEGAAVIGEFEGGDGSADRPGGADDGDGLAILDLLYEMQDPRGLPALLEALNWRTEVSEQHAIRAAQTIEDIDVPSAERPGVISARSRSWNMDW